ncbi:hypothetical protein [Pseudoneobacillus sp. C159]
MAKSKAKKLREKLVREGRRNPEDMRSPFAFTDMRTRKTKTKKDYLYKKNHSTPLRGDGSFYLSGYFSKTKLAFPIPSSVVTSMVTSEES